MRLLLSCVMVLALAFPAMAARGRLQGPGQAPGGFQGPTSGVQADTVAKALKAWGRRAGDADGPYRGACGRQR